MKKNYTKIIVLLDRSGSMATIENDMIGGYNQFISEQKKISVGTCDVSFYQFNTQYEVIYENTPIEFVKTLDHSNFRPSGGTSLLDAMGKTINRVGEQLSSLAEHDRPDKVVFIIITDGEENSSITFNFEMIKSMVTKQSEVYNWQFTYLGANQNAWNVGSKMGIISGASLSFAPNSRGITEGISSLNATLSSYRRDDTARSMQQYCSSDLAAQVVAGLDPKYIDPILTKK